MTELIIKELDGGVSVKCVNSTANSLMIFTVECIPEGLFKGSIVHEFCAVYGYYALGEHNKIKFEIWSRNECGTYNISHSSGNITSLQQEQLNLIKQCIETCFKKVKELGININTDAHRMVFPSVLK